MPDLIETLQGKDYGFMRIIANLWGVDFNAPDAHAAITPLSRALLDEQLVQDVIDSVPDEVRAAIQDLINADGRLPWSQFIRKHGPIRSMGPGKRDREKPYLQPSSATEYLWYRGLISKAFLDLPPEPQEYVFIPDDLISLIPIESEHILKPAGRPATQGECQFIHHADDLILDDACTLLAAFRNDIDTVGEDHLLSRANPEHLTRLLVSSRVIDTDLQPDPFETRSFLEASRGQALTTLCSAWLNSQIFNELANVPGLIFEGRWQNDPYRARQAIINLLGFIPNDKWWHLDSFIQGVKDRNPDFQRTAGEYESWYIRKAMSPSTNIEKAAYLKGFSSWDSVEGELIRYMITGPLHWLGFYHLASPSERSPVKAFRMTEWADELFSEVPPTGFHVEDAKVKISPDGQFEVPRLAPRAFRYQIARFCEWDHVIRDLDKITYYYQITPSSLSKAREKGLRAHHLINLIKGGNTTPVSPKLFAALENFEKDGTQATIEPVQVLRVTDPDILQKLKNNRSITRYLGDVLNDKTILVKPGGINKIRKALMDAGYIPEVIQGG